MFQINVLCFRYMYYVLDICIVLCTYGPTYITARHLELDVLYPGHLGTMLGIEVQRLFNLLQSQQTVMCCQSH